MGKILSQAGNSLADLYDVEGSIAGIDTLDTRELPIVHEMGHTVFSERLSGVMTNSSSGAVLQNATWDNELADLGVTPSRIVGVAVFTTLSARVSDVTVSVREPSTDREIPIFSWDLNEGIIVGRIRAGGVSGATEFLQNTTIGTLPSMLIGTDQPLPVDQIAFRGLTTGFGAGSVTVNLVLYRIFPQIIGISSRGLPIPGW